VTATCALCGQEILDFARSQISHQVVGWELPRSGGGLHALSLKYRTGAVAHTACVKLGKYERQAQLWDSKQEELWSESRP
jgi:hypothetical protein